MNTKPKLEWKEVPSLRKKWAVTACTANWHARFQIEGGEEGKFVAFAELERETGDGLMGTLMGTLSSRVEIMAKTPEEAMATAEISLLATVKTLLRGAGAVAAVLEF